MWAARLLGDIILGQCLELSDYFVFGVTEPFHISNDSPREKLCKTLALLRSREPSLTAIDLKTKSGDQGASIYGAWNIHASDERFNLLRCEELRVTMSAPAGTDKTGH